jgi:hypothetical protein
VEKLAKADFACFWPAIGLIALVHAGCGGSSPAPGPTPVPGATIVRGTEHLAWSQSGDLTGLTFRAYIDDGPVALTAATCDTSTPDASCTSPLPPLTDGVHTIALTSVLATYGLESERSESLTVQKMSTTTSSLAALPDAGGRTNGFRLQTPVRPIGGLDFSADVVARGILTPAQLAATPDGRLLAAEADGGVRVVHPGSPLSDVRALEPGDAGSLSAGPLGLAVHPDFEVNHFVYVASLVDEGPYYARLKVVRLRELSDMLSDPSPIFEAPVAADSPSRDAGASRSDSAPRLAFGPDGLLYIALPLGFGFVDQPAASVPDASMLRITDDGQVRSAGPLAGVSAHPLGFTWHSSTGALWLALPDRNRTAVIRASTRSVTTLARALEPLRLPMTYRTGWSPALLLRTADAMTLQDLARTFLTARRDARPSAIRLNVPVATGSSATGSLDSIGDVVSAGDGTWFLVTSNAARAGGDEADGSDVIVRLRPAGPPQNVSRPLSR